MSSPHYPIRTVARLTGLSVDTLRAWERRYQAVVPERGDRGRVYTDRHIERLRLLAALVDRGHAIGSIARLSDAALRKLQRGSQDAPPASTSAAPGLDLEPLFRAMKHYDLPTIDAQLSRYALLLPPNELVFSVVLPTLREIGVRWQAGAINPAQEHLVSGVVRGVLGALLRSMPRHAKVTRVVFATPAGDRHELGLLCGAVLAAAHGYGVIYLGPDLPAVNIADAVQESGAKILVLACTADASAPESDLRALRRLAGRVSIWVGGARAEDLHSAIGASTRYVANLEELDRLWSDYAA